MVYYIFISDYDIIKWRIWPKVEVHNVSPWKDVIITNLYQFDQIYF